MSYINIKTLQVVEASDIVLENPQVSFPNRGWTDEEISPFGYAILNEPNEHPFPGEYEVLVESTPVEIDGKWFKQYVIIPLPENEIENIKVASKHQLLIDVQQHLDKTAQVRKYDSMLSLCTYATSTNAAFQAEAQAGVQWRDDVWTKVYSILDEIDSGVRPASTTFDDIANELPVLIWPALNN